MKVAIVNYGMGNLGSVRRAFEELGSDVSIHEHPVSLFEAHRVVLPGVGAFFEGMAKLRQGGWVEALQKVVEDGRPLLGICLGMHMLAASGEEGGMSTGLNFIPGKVRRLDSLGCRLRIPHVGWNDILFEEPGPLFAHVPQHSDFYFVHSFSLTPDDPQDVAAVAEYDIPLVAAVRRGGVFGTQFHPEKSSRAGRQLLRNFLDYVAC